MQRMGTRNRGGIAQVYGTVAGASTPKTASIMKFFSQLMELVLQNFKGGNQEGVKMSS